MGVSERSESKTKTGGVCAGDREKTTATRMRRVMTIDNTDYKMLITVLGSTSK
jgi:hypothetical protein